MNKECPYCEGVGEIYNHACPYCLGSGYVQNVEDLLEACRQKIISKLRDAHEDLIIEIQDLELYD